MPSVPNSTMTLEQDISDEVGRDGLDPPAVRILGVPVHRVTMIGTLAQVERFMAGSRLYQIATVNPEFVMAAQDDAEGGPEQEIVEGVGRDAGGGAARQVTAVAPGEQ